MLRKQMEITQIDIGHGLKDLASSPSRATKVLLLAPFPIQSCCHLHLKSRLKWTDLQCHLLD
jgi:hypothetical protein